jgi:hypothetical protein
VIRIVVLDKGFISVGVYSQTADEVVLDNAAVIRRWGSSNGLGEIAENGPTSSTILDKTPRERIPWHAVIKTIECKTENWLKHLGVTPEKKKKKA